ncbi:hypothetical protein H2203_001518 [Taxawa tesnikishii (nom. ined.)]|nr:hypothetical protein H2203_001518 [Dothideales sp. JES 119]
MPGFPFQTAERHFQSQRPPVTDLSLTRYNSSIPNLNPLAPGFQPNVMTTYLPLANNPSTELLESKVQGLQKQMVYNDSRHLSDGQAAEHRVEELTKEIADVKEIVTRDLRSLQQQIHELRNKPRSIPKKERTHREKLAAAMKNPALVRMATGQFASDESMSLSDAYLAEAEAAEALGRELKKMAHDIDASIEAGDDNEPPLYPPPQTFSKAITVRELVQSGVGANVKASIDGPPRIESSGESTQLPPLDQISAQPSASEKEDEKPKQVETPASTQSPDEPIRSIEDPSLKADPTWQPTYIAQRPPLDPHITNNIPLTRRPSRGSSSSKPCTAPSGAPASTGSPKSEPASSPTEPTGSSTRNSSPSCPPRPAPTAPNSRPSSTPPPPRTRPRARVPERARLRRRAQGGGRLEYTYYGNYSQTRFSDRLDHDRMVDGVPDAVKMYWAEQLASAGRPGWVTDALMSHFWPKPEFAGPLPSARAASSSSSSSSSSSAAAAGSGEGGIASASRENGSGKRVFERALDDYVLDLRDWEREARMKVSLLRPEAVLAAFGKSDADEEPGLRLWWEYLECVGYDRAFYDVLVKIKNKDVEGAGAVAPDGVAKAPVSERTAKPAQASRKNGDGGSGNPSAAGGAGAGADAGAGAAQQKDVKPGQKPFIAPHLRGRAGERK